MSIATYPRPGRRISGQIAVILCLVGCLSAYGEDPKPGDPVVELPKFVVTDSRLLPQPESWRYCTLPGFEVLSSASERATRRLVNDFQMFREALEIVWPMPAKMATPVVLIICGKEKQFEAFEPEKSEAGGLIGRASLYLKGKKESAIIINMGSSVIDIMSLDQDLDATTGEDSSRIAIDHNKQLYREYVHYLLGKSEPRLPVWFEEGMAQIIMAMNFNPQWIEFGKLEEANTVSAAAAANAAINAISGGTAGEGDEPALLATAPAEDKDFNAALKRRALLPMDRLLNTASDAPEVRNPLGNNTWAKQAYAFVHMGLYGENGRWRKPFSEFLLRSTLEPVNEELFRKCFKMSYKDMLFQLRAYIDGPTVYTSTIFKPKGQKTFLHQTKVELRDATPGEIGRIKGRALVLGGHPDRARTEVIAPYIRGDRDPQLLAALGLVEHESGKDDRARTFLTAAIAGKTTDPEAYLALARFRFNDAIAKPAGSNGLLSAGQVSGVTDLLRTARTLPPPASATYELFAETIARTDGPATREDALLLVEGVQLFPTRLKLAFQAAEWCRAAGMLEAAHSLADHGLKYAPDAPTKARFQQLKTSLPPAPATPATPQPEKK